MENKTSHTPVADTIKSNAIYQYNCYLGEYWSPDTNVSCILIGRTTMTLRERVRNYRYKGPIRPSFYIRPKLDYKSDDMKIMYQAQNKLGLPILFFNL